MSLVNRFYNPGRIDQIGHWDLSHCKKDLATFLKEMARNEIRRDLGNVKKRNFQEK